MKLLDALRIINAPADTARPTRHFVLVTGFTPLALESFLAAHLRERARPDNVRVSSGRFADLAGNLERALAERPYGVAVVIEWSDIDPRLGLRGHGAVAAPGAAEDLVRSGSAMLERLAARIRAVASVAPTAVILPTLATPPYFLDLPHVAGTLRLRLDAALANFAADLAATERVRIVDAARLAVLSPAADRADAQSDLSTGFPYRREHAQHVAAALAGALLPKVAKKGLITDLDDTLWRGILGEVGIAGVLWGLANHAHVHSLYQQCLTNLIEAGVLVAIASKNDAAIVEEALRRDDLIAATERIYPVHASWGPKSAAIGAILRTWNVGADSVVFVDDSPIELAEVQAAHPDVECLLFRPDSPSAVVTLLQRLADAFGREVVREEDRLRSASIRQSAALQQAVAGDPADAESFLMGLGADVRFVFSRDRTDGRALELVNKTNQFNLNGRRVGESEWAEALARPGAFLLTVDYSDKFGPLGKIGVVSGVVCGAEARIESWVLSCRAFARRIEHATLQAIFDALGVAAVTLDVTPTPRNAPAQDFVAGVSGTDAPNGTVRVTRAAFERDRPALAHRMNVQRTDGVGARDAAGA